MESLIEYYYDIKVVSIKRINDDDYFIQSDNGYYVLSLLYEDIINIQGIIDVLNKTNIKYHLLLINKDHNLFFVYEEKKYCLLKVRCDNNKIDLLNNIKVEGKSDWPDIWGKRIDYYEKQVDEIIEDKSIKYAIQYYIGLTEIAIHFGNELKSIYPNVEYSINHKRLSIPINLLEYYNPLNMIVDIDIRDLAEYFKLAFFEDILTAAELLNMIGKYKLNEEKANYLFLRLLYPSYFFNLYDKYIETKEIDNKMLVYIKKSKDYESLLCNVYNKLILNYNIRINLWFIKFQH